MVDVGFPVARPARWRVPGFVVLAFFIVLLLMNWSAVLVAAQSHMMTLTTAAPSSARQPIE
jgi:hypothetical protein